MARLPIQDPERLNKERRFLPLRLDDASIKVAAYPVQVENGEIRVEL